MAHTRQEARGYRRQSIRRKILGSSERPRLAVFRSQKHMYAQLIDDAAGVVLAAASTLDKQLRSEQVKANLAGAKRLGEIIAERAQAKQLKRLVFDRGGYLYHGLVKALADGARAKGLEF